MGTIGGADNVCLQKSSMPVGRIGIFMHGNWSYLRFFLCRQVFQCMFAKCGPGVKHVKTLYLIGPDGLVNQGHANFKKMVCNTMVHLFFSMLFFGNLHTLD